MTTRSYETVTRSYQIFVGLHQAKTCLLHFQLQTSWSIMRSHQLTMFLYQAMLRSYETTRYYQILTRAYQAMVRSRLLMMLVYEQDAPISDHDAVISDHDAFLSNYAAITTFVLHTTPPFLMQLPPGNRRLNKTPLLLLQLRAGRFAIQKL